VTKQTIYRAVMDLPLSYQSLL